MKMCQAFAQSGHDVRLAARTAPDSDATTEDVFDFYGVHEPFHLRRIPFRQRSGAVYLYALQAALWAWRQQSDLVYGRCLYSCYVSTLLGLPVIFEAHSPLQSDRWRTQWVHHRLLHSPRLQRLVVISNALREAYCTRYNVPAEKVYVAHDAADDPYPTDCDSTLVGDDGSYDSNRLRVGYVGHLYPGKGMEVIAPLAESCPWADFHIIGGTDEDIAHWTQRLEEKDNITFHGFIPHAETAAYRDACDVLLAPYQRSVSTVGGGDVAKWMSPLKIFEYMAASKPIVSSDLPVLREVLRHRENAWLCDPDDHGDWVAALTHLRDHPDERARLGAQARNEFEAKYTWTARAERVLDRLSP